MTSSQSVFRSVFLYFLLALLFARYSLLYLCLFLFSFAFLSPYSAYFGVLSNFLARFSRIAYVFYFLFFLGRSVSYFSSYFHPKPSLHKLELEQFPPVDKALALAVFLLCELIRNCKILRISVQLQSHQFDFPLKTRLANYLLTQLHIYLPTSSPRAMPNCVPAVRYTEAGHSNMHTSLSSVGISWRTLMRYPSYARNHACALPSPSPFHCVMAQIVPVAQLVAHAKSSTLYSRSYGRTVVSPNFFG